MPYASTFGFLPNFAMSTSSYVIYGMTYAAQFRTTVTTLWRSTLLLGVKVSELTTRSPDDTGLVGLGVVSVPFPSVRVPEFPFEYS